MVNMMHLVAAGCSMTYGEELEINAPDKDSRDNYRLDNAWPNILSKMLDCNAHTNLGFPGASNDRIFRSTLEYILNWNMLGQPIPLFLVVGWTNPSRREFMNRNDDWIQIYPAKKPKYTGMHQFQKEYEKTVWNDNDDLIRWFQNIISLQAICNQFDIPYFFFDSITSLATYAKERATVDVEPYLNQLNGVSYYKFMEYDNTMLNKITYNGYKTFPKGHPKEDGHLYWSEILFNEYNKRSKL